MKICPKCKSEWPDTARFCPKCGNPLVDQEEEDDEETRATVMMSVEDLQKLQLHGNVAAQEAPVPKDEAKSQEKPEGPTVERGGKEDLQEQLQVVPQSSEQEPIKTSGASDLELVSPAVSQKPSFLSRLLGFFAGLVARRHKKEPPDEVEEPAFTSEHCKEPSVNPDKPVITPEQPKVSEAEVVRPHSPSTAESGVPEVEDSQKIGEFSETKWFMAGDLIKDEEITPEDLPVEDLQKVYERREKLPEDVREKYSLRRGSKETHPEGSEGTSKG